MSPFADDPRDRLDTLGEIQLIHRIQQWLGSATPPSPAGIGDDCAVFSPSRPDVQQLITTDPVLYGQHFEDALEPEQVAAKLVNRNLSDVAAMGGRPTLAVLSLAADPAGSLSWLERFYRQVARIAQANAFAIAGGDLTSAPTRFMGAFLTLVGETVSPRPLLRRRSELGAGIYVTGELGGTLRRKHHAFTPRLAEGQWLALSGLCLSCADLSDGLGKDYASILAPEHAARIDCAALPVAPDALATAEASGKPPLYHAFNDGEDYELLFALSPRADAEDLEARWTQQLKTPLTRIGTVVARSESPSKTQLILENAPRDLLATGYEHLRKA